MMRIRGDMDPHHCYELYDTGNCGFSAVFGAGAAVARGGPVLLRLAVRAVPQAAGRDEGQLPAGHLPGPARPHTLLHDQVPKQISS